MASHNDTRMVASFFLNARGTYELFGLWVWENPTDYGCNVYDVDWCRVSQCYAFHESGCGFKNAEISGPYWTNAPELVKASRSTLCDRKARARNKTRRLPSIPRHFRGSGTLLEWLEANAIMSSVEYCSICRSYFPTIDTDYPCDHIWWCEPSSEWSTPDNRVADCACEECVTGKAVK